MTRPAVLVVDAALVIAFAVTGRLSHTEGLSPAGVLETGWPFLLGLLLGWALVVGTGRPPLEVSSGVLVWVCTVVGGMLLRMVTDAGTAGPFVVVATLVTGALLVGWRLLARLLTPSTRPRP